LGNGKLDKVLSDIDKATWKNPTEAMKDNLISQKYMDSLDDKDSIKRAYKQQK
jgi:hypothetical protein